MDRLLERHELLHRLRRTRNLNKEIELVILKLPTNYFPGPNYFTGEVYQTFKEDLTAILDKLFQELEKEGIM
jgi:hypothetical protein